MSAMGGKRTLQLTLAKRFANQPPRILHPVERDEAAHAGALRGAEQGFVERLEPAAQAFERVALADFEDGVLDDLAVGLGRELRKLTIEVAQRFGFRAARWAALERWDDEIARVIDGEADQLVELGIA